ncbi:hypothetical protein [Leptospira idonii]|uniref:Uncharacterized protein n=1 Tax=Leptospira idonii TaxID=1193500 RepID=A0A4R9LZM1_9LEPT|nr:hypothetical protein [Leptospira idonii]TGN17610.1 hypothetical protein EHS15_16390 [Leptospira idonii]
MNEIPRKGRDFLDLLDTYKYMNDPIFWETMEPDGRWDFAQGWVHLHIPESEWRLRLAEKFPPLHSEGTNR